MNVFDIVGPVMIGPSSSHTAGAVRIGYVAGLLLGMPAVKAEIHLHGSFAKTYKGHGTDKALIAGILGMMPDDERIRNSPRLAEETGLAVTIIPDSIPGAHPNTALILLTSAQGDQVSVQGSSIGGGNIVINQINGLPVEFSGQSDTLIVLHRDTAGVIAEVSQYLGERGINISNFRLSRSEKGGIAIMTIEVDGKVETSMNEHISGMPNILRSIALRLH
ncbi:MAG: L-serine ammonia-lyase, iron-sulfur-dependent subunit beta [Eubacteriales bacterium]